MWKRLQRSALVLEDTGSGNHKQLTVTPPTTTLSEYTVPDAPEPSPYEMDQVYPDFTVPDVAGLYFAWPVDSLVGVRVENTQLKQS